MAMMRLFQLCVCFFTSSVLLCVVDLAVFVYSYGGGRARGGVGGIATVESMSPLSLCDISSVTIVATIF
jgi:hypothetical protein